MAKFRFSQDQKVTVWHRVSFDIEADTREDAIEYLKEHANEEIDFLEEPMKNGKNPNIDITSSEPIYDTMEFMTPRENDGFATLEIYPQGHYNSTDLICCNGK